MKLFPPYLDKGSRDLSVDGPVHYLGHLVQWLGWAVPGLVIDFDYGEFLAESVKNMQRELGFTGDDVDGNFGPGTREALALKMKINVDLMETLKYYVVSYRSPGMESSIGWPTAA